MAKDPKRPGGTPPVAHRFKPGQSGNPGGRPKKRPTLRETIQDRLERLVWVTTPEGRAQVPMREALSDRILGALADDPETFVKMVRWLEGDQPAAGGEREPSETEAADDADLIAQAIERLARPGVEDE